MPTQSTKAVNSRRHTGRECRYPDHRDVKDFRHPWLLGSGIPCRNDVSLSLTLLSYVLLEQLANLLWELCKLPKKTEGGERVATAPIFTQFVQLTERI
jgi:hypothetical protein